METKRWKANWGRLAVVAAVMICTAGPVLGGIFAEVLPDTYVDPVYPWHYNHRLAPGTVIGGEGDGQIEIPYGSSTPYATSVVVCFPGDYRAVNGTTWGPDIKVYCAAGGTNPASARVRVYVSSAENPTNESLRTTWDSTAPGLIELDLDTFSSPVRYVRIEAAAGTVIVDAVEAINYIPTPPVAEAGPDVSIYTSQQATTTVGGMGTDPSPGPNPLTYQWLEELEGEDAVPQGWTDVGQGGLANLNLATLVASLAIGMHTLRLEVTDGVETASDTMVLTISNTPPETIPASGHVLEIGIDAIIIQGSVADFDGDALTYQWVKDGQVLESGSTTAVAGGAEVSLPDLIILAGDPRFPLGENVIHLVVSDGINPPESASAKVVMQDTTDPTVTPTASALMLWPPNHQLVPITVWANGADNAGGSGIMLMPSVTSSEPDDGSSDQDWFVDSVDNNTGAISLRLRAERSGSGEGRVYTITVTATDASSNSSVAAIDIRVPHDKRKQ
jgi:hypothetical protein